MSVVSLANVQCETIQFALDTQFGICNPVLDPMPALEAIITSQKAAGIVQSVYDPGEGKVKTVKVIYEQRVLESDVTDTTGDRTCTSTNAKKNNFTTYDIDPRSHVSYDEVITVAEMATVCIPFEEHVAKKIAKIVDGIERKTATKTAQALVALYGKWNANATSGNAVGNVNTSDELVVSTFISAATKSIDYNAMTTIDLNLMLANYCQPPIIVGGSALWAYGQAVNAGCCQTTGVNILEIAAQHGKAIAYDKRVAAALGSDLKAIAFQPGSVALLYYNEYDETGLVRGTNYVKFKVFSPRTGLPIDIVMKDDCGTISIVGYATTELVGLPTDMFAVGDELRGTKLVNKILVTNPA